MTHREVTAYIANCDRPGCNEGTELAIDEIDLLDGSGWWFSPRDDTAYCPEHAPEEDQ